MIRCPKCSFQQPNDQFCAKCGVNMTSFESPKKIQNLFKTLIPIFLVVIGFVTIFHLYKSVDLTEKNEANQLTQRTTKIGIKAGSLREDDPPTQFIEENIVETQKEPQPKVPKDAVIEHPSEVILNYVLAEMNTGLIENYDSQKNFFLTTNNLTPNVFFNDQITLTKGVHTIIDNGEDTNENFKMNLKISVEEIQKDKIKIKFSYSRFLSPNMDYQKRISFTETISKGQTLVVPDKIERKLSKISSSSILSNLMQSQQFLTDQSELMHVLKFQEAQEIEP